MQLNVALVTYHLRDRNPVMLGKDERELDLLDARIGLPRAGDAHGDTAQTLFIARPEDIAHASVLPAHVLCAGEGADAVGLLKEQGVQGVVVPGNVDPAVLFDEVQRLFRRYRLCEQALVELIVTGCDVAPIMDCCARFFENPVLMLNESLRVVALSTQYPHRADDAYWRETEATGYLDEGALASMRREGILRELQNSRSATLIDIPACPRRLSANIFEGGERMVSLCVDEACTPLSVLQAGLLEHLAQLLGAYLAVNRIVLGRQPLSFRDYVRCALHGEAVDAAERQAFLSRRGWDEHDAFCVVVMRASAASREHGVDRLMLRTAAASLPDMALVEESGDAVAVVRRDWEEGLAWRPEEEFAARIERAGALCGVSLPFGDFSLVRDAYQLALALLDDAARKGASPGVYRARECLFDYVIAAESEQVNPLCLCHPGVLALNAYDRAHGTDLLDTLRCYLEHGSNMVHAAEALFVHRNTLVYRLKRANEIGRFDYGRPDEILHVLFSCKVLKHVRG